MEGSLILLGLLAGMGHRFSCEQDPDSCLLVWAYR